METKLAEAKRHLLKLQAILKFHDEHGFLSGLEQAINAVESGNIKDARSIFNSLSFGGKKLVEWKVERVNPTESDGLNKPIEELKAKINALFSEF